MLDSHKQGAVDVLSWGDNRLTILDPRLNRDKGLPNDHPYGTTESFWCLLRGIFMSTWGVLPAVFRPFWTVFPGLGAGFLNLGGKMGRTAKKWGKNGGKWARNGLKRVGVS